jgi:hypothetical protein
MNELLIRFAQAIKKITKYDETGLTQFDRIKYEQYCCQEFEKFLNIILNGQFIGVKRYASITPIPGMIFSDNRGLNNTHILYADHYDNERLILDSGKKKVIIHFISSKLRDEFIMEIFNRIKNENPEMFKKRN